MWQVRDELWDVVAPLVPVHEPDPRGGRPRVDDGVCFGAIVFVLFTGIAWQHLPRELGCSPATAHRRLQEWQRAGVWTCLHRELLRRLNAAGRIDWSQAVIDGSYVRALQGGVDRALSGRPCPQWLQAPPPDRRERRPARGLPNRRPPQRRHPALAADRRRHAGPRPGWTAALAQRAAACRPRLMTTTSTGAS